MKIRIDSCILYVTLVVFCCETNHSNIQLLETTLITLQFLWISELGTAEQNCVIHGPSEARLKLLDRTVVISMLNWQRIFFHAQSLCCWQNSVFLQTLSQRLSCFLLYESFQHYVLLHQSE